MAFFFTSSSSPSRLLLRGAAALWLATAGSACGGEETSECLPEPLAACTPEINTDFASIHRALFAQRCGTTGGACHGSEGRKGNLVLADADTAYDALLGMDGTPARVSPGDPACSLLLQRLESDDPAKRMPLGENKLSEGLRCAVRTWIEAGAAR
jgi:hypothetical protein